MQLIYVERYRIPLKLREQYIMWDYRVQVGNIEKSELISELLEIDFPACIKLT